MDRISNGKPAKGLGLQLQQLVSAMVDGAADLAVLPHGMLHAAELLELGHDLVVAHALLGQTDELDHAGLLGHQFLLELGQGGLDLPVDLGADARGAQEERVEDQAEVGVEVAQGAEDAMAAEGVERAAQQTQDEDEEDDVPGSTGC